MAVRATVHQAGRRGPLSVLRFPRPPIAAPVPVPAADRPTTANCARSAFSPLGAVEMTRPYYLCSDCHAGQFPADGELDIENTEFSPGVRRMHALVVNQDLLIGGANR